MSRVALVTGAAGGIGLGIARALAQAKHRVLMVDVQAPLLDTSVAALHSEGLDVRGAVCDLAEDSQIAQLPQQLGADFAAIDVLVNNAAISPKHEGRRLDSVDVPLDEWERVLKINLTAPFRLAQLCIPAMRERRFGRIVNISSKGGRSPGGVAAIHYVTTKTALLGFTRSLAKDYAKDGITANAIAPGRVSSPMTDGSSEAVRAEMVKGIPVGRIGSPDEIGALAAFLAGDLAGYITGATIDVNGGAVMI